jgi:hypothetical protein
MREVHDYLTQTFVLTFFIEKAMKKDSLVITKKMLTTHN